MDTTFQPDIPINGTLTIVAQLLNDDVYNAGIVQSSAIACPYFERVQALLALIVGHAGGSREARAGALCPNAELKLIGRGTIVRKRKNKLGSRKTGRTIRKAHLLR